MPKLDTLDWIVFFAVNLFTLLAVFLVRGHKNNSIVDYLLMGRRLTLPLFVATLVATWYGGIMGVAQIAYQEGIYNFITQGFFWYLTYIIFALFMVKKIREGSPLTLPDLVENHFGEKARFVASIFNFTNMLPIAYITSIGLLLQMFFPISFLEGMVYGAGFVYLYSLMGGFNTVVVSDIVQFIVMCTSVFLLLILSISSHGLAPLKTLPPEMFSLDGGHGLLTTFVWGLIALSTLVDPNFYQRCFAARTSKIATRGILISTFIWFLFDLSLTIGAMYARALLPGHPEDGYIRYALTFLPSGLRGYFLAGVAAIILSTLNSYLFIAGTTLTYDFKFIKKLKSWHHHMAVFFVTILSIFIALFFEGNIKSIWKTFGSYSASCLLVPISFKLLLKVNITQRAFLTSILFSVISVTIWQWIPRYNLWKEIDAIYIGSFVSFLIIFTYSLRTKTY